MSGFYVHTNKIVIINLKNQSNNPCNINTKFSIINKVNIYLCFQVKVMTTATERRGELKQLMADYSASIKDVAQILDRSEQTVKNWRSSSSDSIPPKNELRLLKFELEARKAKQEKTPADANS